MSAPTIIGTTHGIYGVQETQTGLVFESCDYNYSPEKIEFPDRYGNTTATAYFNEKTEINLKGFMVSGTSWTGTLASTLTLTSTMPAHLKSGNTGGSCIIEGIKIGDVLKNWRSIDITVTYYPNVS